MYCNAEGINESAGTPRARNLGLLAGGLRVGERRYSARGTLRSYVPFVATSRRGRVP